MTRPNSGHVLGGSSPGVPGAPRVPPIPGTNPQLAPYLSPAGQAPAPTLTDYTNPYSTAVLDKAIGKMGDLTTQRRNQLGTEAFGSGAYGDARHGVESANLTKDFMEGAGQLSAQVGADGFDKAQSWLDTDLDRREGSFDRAMGWQNVDIDRQTQTAFNNQSLDNQWFQNQLGAMGLGTDMDSTAYANLMRYADGLMGLDQYDRGQQQQDLDIGYSDWLDNRNWDSSKLNEFLGFVNGTPGSGGGTTSSSPDTSWASMLAASLGGLERSDGTRLFGN